MTSRRGQKFPLARPARLAEAAAMLAVETLHLISFFCVFLESGNFLDLVLLRYGLQLQAVLDPTFQAWLTRQAAHELQLLY